MAKLHQEKNSDNLHREVQLVFKGYGLLLQTDP